MTFSQAKEASFRMPLFDISLIFTKPDFPGEQLCDPWGTGFGPHTE